MTIAPPVPDELEPDEGPDTPDLPDPAFPEVLPGGNPGPSEVPDEPQTEPAPEGS